MSTLHAQNLRAL